MATSLLFDPAIIPYETLFFAVGYLTITSLIFGRTPRGRSGPSSVSPFLKLVTALTILATASIPLVYRVIASDSAILAWECESVLAYYLAMVQGQSFGEFAWESIKANPGVLSASARSVYYGFPTFEVFSRVGASIFSLRIIAFVAGLVALIPAYYIVKKLFNASVAVLFITVLATNPLYLFYMGYGVSQTATFFGFLIALALTVAAMQMTSASRFLVAIVAGVAFLVSLYNYAPERLFVVITVGYLLAYALYYALVRGGNAGGVVAAFLASITVGGLFAAVKWLDPWSEFFTARGEQVFTLVHARWFVASYLGNTPEVQAYDLANPPLLLQAKFFLAVAEARLEEFMSSMAPTFWSSFSYQRGSHNAPGFPLYQGGLVIPLVIGFVAALRSLRRAGSAYFVGFFFLGLIPLLLTTRFDRHRAFFLLVPLSLWIAHGLYLCIERYSSGIVGRIHSGLVTLALGIGLVVNASFFMAMPDATPADHAVLSKTAPSLVAPNTSIAMGLECAPQAPLSLKLLQLRTEQNPASFTLWDPEFGKFLTDGRFTATRPEFLQLVESLSSGKTAVLITDQPTTQFRAELAGRGYAFSEEQRGGFVIMRMTPKK